MIKTELKRYSKDEAVAKMNSFGTSATPFVFFVDFELEKIIVEKLTNVGEQVYFDFNGVTNVMKDSREINRSPVFRKTPMKFDDYQLAFQKVLQEIRYGNSFLLNLAFPTQIETELSLLDIFLNTNAKYKCYLKDEFVCFSPEIFIQIQNDVIKTFPMKGTIDANVPDAEAKILEDQKEMAEHCTIVDLLRNDLSQIAKGVEVTRFRYIDRLQTNEKELLQASSEIRGSVPIGWQKELGTHLFKLLPAGSICGAPKAKTIEIIQSAEGQDRGYYTGVCGVFDGKNLDSGVMIRYIERTNDGLQYRSGGGITFQSKAKAEFQEMIDKVYLPI